MKTIVPIKGMHCRSCEILVGDNLRTVPGVNQVEVSVRSKEATIHSSELLDMEKVRRAVSDAGYAVGKDDAKNWLSSNPKDYRELLDAVVLTGVLFFLAKWAGLLNLNVGSGSNPSSLLVVLMVGLTAGVSTCMALVGGLVLGVSARHAEKHPEATPMQKFRPHFFFNLGRIISYTLLGGVIGILGKAFQFSGPSLGIMMIVVGVVMFVLGAQLTEIFPRLSATGLTLPSGIAKLLGLRGRHEKEYSHGNSALIGALTFFLPCGFTQAMQLFAMSTGSFTSGAMIMGTFALGTAPGLLGVGGFTSLIKGSFAKKFFKFAGVVVVGLAFLNIANGYNLTGWPSFWKFSGSGTTANGDVATTENGFQVLQMKQGALGYSPNSFTIKKGVPVRLVINSENVNTCAASFMIPKLGIRKQLQPGANTIEFTPKEVGEIKFTCSMGMFTGKFNVVESAVGGQKTSAVTKQPVVSPVPTIEAQNSASIPGVQLIKTTFLSPQEDIYPNQFTVTAGKPVQFDVDVKADGQGCMSTIMIPGLVDSPTFLEKGKTVRFNFTPEKGSYQITCAMGVPRGVIVVI
ncbi:MAG: sulfite exporter TauE/SafE family protein [bacterium]|nr:sulfite exporter TauE/SafE family protein [bacterium]